MHVFPMQNWENRCTCRPAVAGRIRKLEQDSVITGYSVAVDMDKLGMPVLAMVQCKVFRAMERQFKKLLLTIPDIIECYNTTGEQTFVIKMATRSMARLDEILELFKDMRDTNTMMILSTRRYVVPCLIPFLTE